MQKLVEKLGFSESATSAILWVGLSLVLLVIVAALAFWLVRTLRPSLNMNGNGGRGGRPQRLAVTDAFPLDRDGRKLVIVRRDNTEHLLLIGGPNDLLVESNITRHDRSARGLGRNVGDAEGEDAFTAPAAPVQAPLSMPAAPQPVSAPSRSDEFDRALAGQRPLVPPEPVMRPPQTPVVAPAVVVPAAVALPVATPPVSAPPVAPVAPESQPQEASARAMPPAPPVLTLESLLPDPVPVAPSAPAPEPAAPVESSAPAPTPPPRAPAMSEMARRLNEALQKPMSGTLRPPFNRSIPPAPPTAGVSATPTPTPPMTPVAPVPPPAPPIATPVAAPPAPEPAVAALDTEAVAKADMDLLEEEMARLLGRPGQPKKPDAS